LQRKCPIRFEANGPGAGCPRSGFSDLGIHEFHPTTAECPIHAALFAA
jgi:hypothetical protein